MISVVSVSRCSVVSHGTSQQPGDNAAPHIGLGWSPPPPFSSVESVVLNPPAVLLENTPCFLLFSTKKPQRILWVRVANPASGNAPLKQWPPRWILETTALSWSSNIRAAALSLPFVIPRVRRQVGREKRVFTSIDRTRPPLTLGQVETGRLFTSVLCQ